MTTPLHEAARLLAGARAVVVFTGAGVSAESGVPTYRSGADGLWSVQNMARYANPRGYRANLPESYAWYRARAESLAAVQPNAAHHAIARMTSLVPRPTVITQNIDSLHQRAGSRDVIELHGHLRSARCDGCQARFDWTTAPTEPRCPDCSGMLRPDVVMFEEMLPEDACSAAWAAARTADVLLSVGTSNQVAPASDLPLVALQCGASVIIVNPDMNGQPSHGRTVKLAGLAGTVVPDLVERAWPRGFSAVS
jgi:NAD-dependent deacetylase